MTDAAAGTAVSLPRPRLAGWVYLLRQSFAAHWLVVGIPLVALIANEFILSTIDEPRRAGVLSLLFSMVALTLPAGLLAIALVRFVQMVFYEKPPSPTRALIGDVKALLRSPVRLVNALPVLIAVILCSKAMLEIKSNIPTLHPFSWDETLMRLDRLLHGGIDPWLWLQPALGHPPVTFFIDVAYYLWFLALFGMVVYFAFRKKFDELRLQFFVAHMIIWWFGGALMALFFSSAGPVYYALIGLSPDPFANLLDYLHTADAVIPLSVLNVHEMLWDGYTGQSGSFLGISAFPSMHNAMATLFVLAGWRIHRSLGACLAVFAALILIGSVHLAWHYAVDSYAGIAIGVIAWWIAGRLARWNSRLPQARRYRGELERAACERVQI